MLRPASVLPIPGGSKVSGPGFVSRAVTSHGVTAHTAHRHKPHTDTKSALI